MPTNLPPDVANHLLTKAYEACSDKPLTLGALLHDVAARYAGNQVLAFRGQAISYRELLAQARATARALIAGGCGKGTRVGILMSSRPEYFATVYGIAMAGGIVVPLHTVATANDREFMLQHSDCAILIMQAALARHDWLGEFLERHSEVKQQTSGQLRLAALPWLRRVVCLDDARGVAGVQPWQAFLDAGASVSDALLDGVAAQVHPSDDAVIIYTSGSTGSPKGVLHRHRAACLQQWRAPIIYGMAEDERIWSVNPFFWSAGFSFFMGAITSGGCLVLQEHFDPGETLELLERERVTMLASAVATLAPLCDHPDVTRRNLSAVRHLPTNAGLRRFLNVEEKKWGPTTAYGLTETFASATYVIPDEADPITDPGGYPMPGMRFRIVDPATGKTLGPNEKGEIAATGMQTMRTYYKKSPEECFDAEGYIRTGDEGYIDDRGRVHYTARLSNMIKTKGANVSPMEIEEVLSRWGRIKLPCVVGIPSEVRGEDVVACIVKRDDLDVTAEEVMTFLRKELASYKVPRHVVFMKQEDIPMTGSNKPRLGDMRKIAASLIAAAQRN
jgi:fatty-acyl-CoA synthase